jgi:hypothetical protein
MTVGKEGEEKPIETMTKDELTGIFRQIGGHIKQQGETILAMHTELKALREGGGGEEKPTPKGGEEIPTPANLEEMSRDQLEAHMMGKMTTLLAPIQAAISTDRDGRIRENLTEQVHAANTAHDDFPKWFDEIKRISQEHPTMDVETVYQMARMQDPDKTKGIDADLRKVADEAAIKDKKEEAEVIRPVEFGGLLPTSGVVAEKKDGGMTSEEAGEAAWDATQMGKHLEAISDN